LTGQGYLEDLDHAPKKYDERGLLIEERTGDYDYRGPTVSITYLWMKEVILWKVFHVLKESRANCQLSAMSITNLVNDRPPGPGERVLKKSLGQVKEHFVKGKCRDYEAVIHPLKEIRCERANYIAL
jgi:hypothetical protein